MRCYTAAATLLLLLVPLAAEAATASYGERTEEETRRVFVEWMAKHGMAYESAAEEERRYAIFKDKLRIVEQHSAGADAGIHPYRLGLNSFSDRTSAETCCQQTKNRNKKRNKESLARSGGASAASVWLKDSILCGSDGRCCSDKSSYASGPPGRQ